MRTAFVDNSTSMTGGMETVITPEGMNISMMDGPLDPVFTRLSLQRTEDMDLDTQPMRGPRENKEIPHPTSWTTSLMTIMVTF